MLEVNSSCFESNIEEKGQDNIYLSLMRGYFEKQHSIMWIGAGLEEEYNKRGRVKEKLSESF